MKRPAFDFPGRVAGNDGPRIDIFHHDGARANYRALPHCHAGTDKRIRANPRLITNNNRRLKQWQVCPRVVMCAGAKMKRDATRSLSRQG